MNKPAKPTSPAPTDTAQREPPLEAWRRSRAAYRTPEVLRGRPCVICGSVRSVRGFVAGYGPNSADPQAVCEANLSGRDRCRERELRVAFPSLRRR